MERTSCLACLALGAALAPAAPVIADPGVMIVQLAPGASIDEINADYGTSVVDSIASQQIYLLETPEGTDPALLEDALEGDPRISDAELNDEGETPDGSFGGNTQSFFFYVDPEGYSDQWAEVQVGLDTAHQATTGGGVTIALLDTGVDVTHGVLAPLIAPGGFNFVDMSPDVADVGNGLDDDGDGQADEMTGHGTFMAGLIAVTAPSAKILPIKVLDSDGTGFAFAIANGIFHAVEHGADVINISFGNPTENTIVELATEFAIEAGVVVVGAAGNLGQSQVQYPAADDGVIGVASTDAADIKSEFSNYGEEVSLSAPGTLLVSTMPGNLYAESNGTSMASALVAGAAALLRSVDASLTPAQVESALQSASADIDELNPEFDGELGEGRLDIGQALAGVGNPADLDHDGVVGTNDFLLLLSAWGLAGSPADLDGDDTVGTSDMLLLLAAWG